MTETTRDHHGPHEQQPPRLLALHELSSPLPRAVTTPSAGPPPAATTPSAASFFPFWPLSLPLFDSPDARRPPRSATTQDLQDRTPPTPTPTAPRPADACHVARTPHGRSPLRPSNTSRRPPGCSPAGLLGDRSPLGNSPRARSQDPASADRSQVPDGSCSLATPRVVAVKTPPAGQQRLSRHPAYLRQHLFTVHATPGPPFPRPFPSILSVQGTPPIRGARGFYPAAFAPRASPSRLGSGHPWPSHLARGPRLALLARLGRRLGSRPRGHRVVVTRCASNTAVVRQESPGRRLGGPPLLAAFRARRASAR